MARLLLMLLCVAFSTACCMNKAPESEGANPAPDAKGPVCTLFRAGQVKPAAPADSLAALALRLLESSEDQALLIVTKDLVAGIKDADSALEVVFPDTLTVTGPTGVKHRLDRVLIPLSGEYGPGEDLSSTLILFGTGAYSTGPWMNRHSRADLLKLKALLGL